MARPAKELPGATQADFAAVVQHSHALCVAHRVLYPVFDDVGVAGALQGQGVIENVEHALCFAIRRTE